MFVLKDLTFKKMVPEEKACSQSFVQVVIRTQLLAYIQKVSLSLRKLPEVDEAGVDRMRLKIPRALAVEISLCRCGTPSVPHRRRQKYFSVDS
jgi:hypothetical protein